MSGIYLKKKKKELGIVYVLINVQNQREIIFLLNKVLGAHSGDSTLKT